MRLEIETNLDNEMQEFLYKKYCNRCSHPKETGFKPGCCKYCYLIIDFEIKKKPSDFKKEKEAEDDRSE